MTAPLTESEIDYARRLAAMERGDLAPGQGIIIWMLVGAAVWLVIGIVIYFTFIAK